MALVKAWKANLTPESLTGAVESGVKSLGLKEAKPIQSKAIKCALNGEDVVFVSYLLVMASL